MSLLGKVSTPEHSRYAAWQFGALAGLLDALDQRNSSLTKLEQDGKEDMKAAVGQLAKIFAAARATATDTHASLEERLQAIRLLGRGPDHRQDDVAALAGLLVPQAAEALQAGAVASSAT